MSAAIAIDAPIPEPAHPALILVPDDPILVVDDDEAMRKLLSQRLRLLGREAVPADSVRTAIALLETTRVGAIVSDYSMPGATGLELLAYATRRFPETPFVLMSGLVDEDVAAVAISLGASSVLAKDDLLDELPAVLDRTYGGHSGSSASHGFLSSVISERSLR